MTPEQIEVRVPMKQSIDAAGPNEEAMQAELRKLRRQGYEVQVRPEGLWECDRCKSRITVDEAGAIDDWSLPNATERDVGTWSGVTIRYQSFGEGWKTCQHKLAPTDTSVLVLVGKRSAAPESQEIDQP